MHVSAAVSEGRPYNAHDELVRSVRGTSIPVASLSPDLGVSGSTLGLELPTDPLPDRTPRRDPRLAPCASAAAENDAAPSTRELPLFHGPLGWDHGVGTLPRPRVMHSAMTGAADRISKGARPATCGHAHAGVRGECATLATRLALLAPGQPWLASCPSSTRAGSGTPRSGASSPSGTRRASRTHSPLPRPLATAHRSTPAACLQRGEVSEGFTRLADSSRPVSHRLSARGRPR